MIEEIQRLAPQGVSGRSLVRYAAASSLLAMFLSALTIYNGPSVIDAPTDVFVLIGGAWRMLLGQIPHVDFHNPIGALTYGFVEAGMAIGGAETLGFPWAATLLLAAAVIWASAVAYSRLEPWLAFGFVVVFLLFVGERFAARGALVQSLRLLPVNLDFLRVSRADEESEEEGTAHVVHNAMPAGEVAGRVQRRSTRTRCASLSPM